MRGVTTDDIDYYGHRIDERSQIIIQLLRDMTEATAGKLRNEAGLDDTSKVHYRVEKHLGPTAACLVEQVGTEPRPGDQSDEVVYGLTDQGLDFAVAHDNELTDAVAAAEAVETLRRIRATVDGFEQRVSEVESSVENMDEWKNRWSTRVGRVEDDIKDEIRRLGDKKPDEEAVNNIQREHRQEIVEIRGQLDGVENQIEKIEDQLDTIMDEFTTRPTADQVQEYVQKSRRKPRQWDIWLAEDIADVREKAEGILGGRL